MTVYQPLTKKTQVPSIETANKKPMYMAFPSNPYSFPFRFSCSFHAFNIIHLKWIPFTLQYIYTNVLTSLYMSLSLLTNLKMEQYSQYLMLAKSNNSILMNPYASHSWEEQAFAEDARGPLGGFIWPPRSYSCSFCRREFRSAQALGGHMNVHRREKAKLKQSVNGSSSATTISPHNHNNKSLCKDSLDHGLFSLALSSSRLSLTPAALGQESLDSISDTKSCVYDEEFVVAHGNGDVETNLVLGFDLDFYPNMSSSSKRRKMGATRPIMADELDLELRLAG